MIRGSLQRSGPGCGGGAARSLGRGIRHRLLAVLAGLAVVWTAPPIAAGQPETRLLVTVLDAEGDPVSGLTRDDFSIRREDTVLEIVSVDPAPSTVQVVAIFEGLAVTQRQLTAALSRLIGSLDDDSVVDMQSVDGDLDAAIMEAVDDLHARAAPRPVIVMLGQASEIAPSELQSSQVRGRRRAADLTGAVDQLADTLAAHGILFYGISVTETPLPNFEGLAAGSGGRFHVLPAPAALEETVARVGRELGQQYVVSIRAADAGGSVPRVTVARPDVTVRVAAYTPTH